MIKQHFGLICLSAAIVLGALFYALSTRHVPEPPHDYLTPNDYFKLSYRIIQLAKSEQISVLARQIERASRKLGVDVSDIEDGNGGSASTNVEAEIDATVVFTMNRPLTGEEYRQIIDSIGHPPQLVLPNDMSFGGATPVWSAKLDILPYDSTSATTRMQIKASIAFSCVDSRYVHPQR